MFLCKSTISVKSTYKEYPAPSSAPYNRNWVKCWVVQQPSNTGQTRCSLLFDEQVREGDKLLKHIKRTHKLLWKYIDMLWRGFHHIFMCHVCPATRVFSHKEKRTEIHPHVYKKKDSTQQFVVREGQGQLRKKIELPNWKLQLLTSVHLWYTRKKQKNDRSLCRHNWTLSSAASLQIEEEKQHMR